MKLWELKRIGEYLKKFRIITDICRVDDNVIKIEFDKNPILFDLKKSDAKIYKREDLLKIKRYNAPFDIALQKRFKKAKIIKVEVPDDKILKIVAESASSYKKEITVLQLEFTGRNTNAIVLTEDGTVIEALRHIDSSVSFREVKPGKKLLDIPKREFKEEPKEIEDIEKYLYEVYEKERQKRLSVLKTSKILQIYKQIEKLEKILKDLESSENLMKEADEYEKKANLILANIHKIKPYQTVAKIEDFDNKTVEIELPPEAKSVSQMADIFFSKAKRLRQKAKNIHIEKENLSSKILFLKRLANIVENAKNPEEIELLFPKKEKRKKEKKALNFEKFKIDEYTIYVGKNEKGNIELLKNAKASDIWLHLKDRPSTHVIIRSNRQNIPEEIIKTAARLCVDFSVDEKGGYLVDYTRRRNVKPKAGANVNYVNYKTVKIYKK
ncbi:NFACT RNA binding domain-containing protein [Nitrosophilus alvini]|uniref:NFACT RNA binding domain-containing protein n=1 Tax=Nitrosophilus alvini TaxID=2714855 RepID=UPI00190A5CA0|nr:NFACT RNA binding domain-containing protein [Nitrosophilus alvini]